jgi:hypothetical protein
MRIDEITSAKEVTEIISIDLDKGMTSSAEIDRNYVRRRKFPHFLIEGNGIKVYVFEKDKDQRYVYAFINSKSYPVMEIEMKRFGESWATNMTSVRKSAQGLGLGFVVYELLIKKGNMMLISDQQQSLGAQKLWKRLYQTPGITVFGYDTTEKDPNKQYFQVHDLDNLDNLDGATRTMYTSWEDEYNIKKDKSKLAKAEKTDLHKATNTRLVAIKSVSR